MLFVQTNPPDGKSLGWLKCSSTSSLDLLQLQLEELNIIRGDPLLFYVALVTFRAPEVVTWLRGCPPMGGILGGCPPQAGNLDWLVGCQPRAGYLGGRQPRAGHLDWLHGFPLRAGNLGGSPSRAWNLVRRGVSLFLIVSPDWRLRGVLLTRAGPGSGESTGVWAKDPAWGKVGIGREPGVVMMILWRL